MRSENDYYLTSNTCVLEVYEALENKEALPLYCELPGFTVASFLGGNGEEPHDPGFLIIVHPPVLHQEPTPDAEDHGGRDPTKQPQGRKDFYDIQADLDHVACKALLNGERLYGK